MRNKLPLSAAAAASLIWLCGFTPFTRVTNVCPTCPEAKTDVLVLSNGFKVRGNVVAQNSDFYVVDRYGEYRAISKGETASVQWRDQGGLANLGTGDQILLRNGVVLHGAITREQPGRYFLIQVGPLSHVAWHSQIQSVHKGGTPYPFTGGAPAAAP